MRCGRALRAAVALTSLWVIAAGCSGGDDDAASKCGPGYVYKQLCTECGPSGGCAVEQFRCTKACKTNPDCEGDFQCLEGYCQFVGCI